MAEQDANGTMPQHLNVDGGAVKEPLKPKAGGKVGPAQPGYDPSSMVHTIIGGQYSHTQYPRILSVLRCYFSFYSLLGHSVCTEVPQILSEAIAPIDR